MAQTKNTEEELNLDQQVTVRSIAPWNTGFARIQGFGDVTIAPKGVTRLTRNEIIAQVQSGNKLFIGTDGEGSHATLYIDDEATRKEVGFESEDGKKKQLIFSNELVDRLFDTKGQEAFERKFTEAIRTRAEKRAVIKAIIELKINDYSKMRFVENYTGYRIQ